MRIKSTIEVLLSDKYSLLQDMINKHTTDDLKPLLHCELARIMEQ